MRALRQSAMNESPSTIERRRIKRFPSFEQRSAEPSTRARARATRRTSSKPSSTLSRSTRNGPTSSRLCESGRFPPRSSPWSNWTGFGSATPECTAASACRCTDVGSSSRGGAEWSVTPAERTSSPKADACSSKRAPSDASTATRRAHGNTLRRRRDGSTPYRVHSPPRDRRRRAFPSRAPRAPAPNRSRAWRRRGRPPIQPRARPTVPAAR